MAGSNSQKLLKFGHIKPLTLIGRVIFWEMKTTLETVNIFEGVCVNNVKLDISNGKKRANFNINKSNNHYLILR